MLSYREAVAQIEALGIMPDRAPSLDPMRSALARLGLIGRIDPDRAVVVAGTNGKGSVCATLEALLLSAGQSVGLYTSPHLVETTERIRIDGRDIAQDEFAGLYERVRQKTRDLRLSHFETLTAMAAWRFYSGEGYSRPDWTILEVGLGGTWDATNAVPHSRCVIASLGIDHENLLGSDLVSIARNKFGIVTNGAYVVHTVLPEEVRSLAAMIAAETGSRWTEAGPCGVEVISSGGEPRFMLQTPWGRGEIVLPGSRGAQNSMTALTALEALGFDPGRHLDALARVRWPGRMERVPSPIAPCPVYLSGDHNPQGVASLLELLPHYPRERLHVIVGIGKDKDADGILAPLFGLPETSVYLTETPFRGRPLDAYGAWLERAQDSDPDPRALFERVALAARKSDLIMVTGSLYLIGEMRRVLSRPAL